MNPIKVRWKNALFFTALFYLRSVQFVARNHEARTEVKSFVHQNARYEGIIESRTGVDSFVHQDARYEGIVDYVSRLNHSCNKLHATRESWITYRGWIIRASRCTLHSKWITLLTVDNALFEKTHAKITTLYFVPCVVWSCIEMHATRESWITYRGWIIRATSCTLRGNRELRTVVESFVQQVARYEGIVNHVSGLNHSCYWIQKAYLV